MMYVLIIHTVNHSFTFHSLTVSDFVCAVFFMPFFTVYHDVEETFCIDKGTCG